MKTITFILDDEIYRKAEKEAARKGTSVYALVEQFLTNLGGSDVDPDQRNRPENVTSFRVPAV